MNPYGLLAIVIAAVLIWLGISAVFLLRGVRRLQRHLEAIQQDPLLQAARRAPQDVARLNRAAAQLSAQMETLRAAADQLNAAIDGLRTLSFQTQRRSISREFNAMVDVLQ
jgi:cell division protein FtsB